MFETKVTDVLKCYSVGQSLILIVQAGRYKAAHITQTETNLLSNSPTTGHYCTHTLADRQTSLQLVSRQTDKDSACKHSDRQGFCGQTE